MIIKFPLVSTFVLFLSSKVSVRTSGAVLDTPRPLASSQPRPSPVGKGTRRNWSTHALGKKGYEINLKKKKKRKKASKAFTGAFVHGYTLEVRSVMSRASSDPTSSLRSSRSRVSDLLEQRILTSGP